MVELSVAQLVDQLRALGVRRSGVLLVHTAFSKVRPVESGPLGLLRALRDALGPDGTLVMPTMTDGETPFDPGATPTHQMGITAELFWRQPGVVRSTHPGASFAAAGPRARQICAPQPLAPPHGPESPVGRVHALGGQVLLLGVTHSESTTLHLAEALAGVPYWVAHPCLVEIDGVWRPIPIAETDHCCRRFDLADAWLRERGLLREGEIGHAHARLMSSRDVVEVTLGELAIDPLRFLCPAVEGCEQCDLARASIGEVAPDLLG